MLRFLVILHIILSSFSVYASDKDWVVYNWDLELALSRMPSRLLVADHPFKKEDVMLIFNELDKMKPRESRKSNISEDDSSGSRESLISTSSQESVEGMEEVLQICFESEPSTKTQLENRHSFIEILHSLEKEIDPVVFQKGVELIATHLIG